MYLFVFKVLIFHEKTELVHPGESSDLSLDNYDSTEGIMLFLVGIYIRNKLGWVGVANGD